MPLIVAFTGRAESGKTTLAAAVHERLLVTGAVKGGGIGRRKFAQPIYDALRCLGIEKGHPLFRSLAQHLSETLRDHDPRMMVAAFERAIDRSTLGVLLVDDCRYVNEADACDLVVKLRHDRPTALTEQQRAHPSEREWEIIDADAEYDTTEPGATDAIADDVARRIVAELNHASP